MSLPSIPHQAHGCFIGCLLSNEVPVHNCICESAFRCPAHWQFSFNLFCSVSLVLLLTLTYHPTIFNLSYILHTIRQFIKPFSPSYVTVRSIQILKSDSIHFLNNIAILPNAFHPSYINQLTFRIKDPDTQRV